MTMLKTKDDWREYRLLDFVRLTTTNIYCFPGITRNKCMELGKINEQRFRGQHSSFACVSASHLLPTLYLAPVLSYPVVLPCASLFCGGNILGNQADVCAYRQSQASPGWRQPSDQWAVPWNQPWSCSITPVIHPSCGA